MGVGRKAQDVVLKGFYGPHCGEKACLPQKQPAAGTQKDRRQQGKQGSISLHAGWYTSNSLNILWYYNSREFLRIFGKSLKIVLKML